MKMEVNKLSNYKKLMDEAEKSDYTPLPEKVDYLFKVAEVAVAYTDEGSSMGADVPYIKYTATVQESANGEGGGRPVFGVIFPYRLSQKTGEVRLQQDALKQVLNSDNIRKLVANGGDTSGFGKWLGGLIGSIGGGAGAWLFGLPSGPGAVVAWAAGAAGGGALGSWLGDQI